MIGYNIYARWSNTSPDFTLCYSFLWEEVYKRKPKTSQDLELEIRGVLDNISIDFLYKSVENVEVKL